MFLYYANYKRLTFPFSLPLSSPASFQPLYAVSEEKGNVDSIREQGSHLLLWITGLLGWVRSEGGARGETERSVISAAVCAKSHVNMTADSAGCPCRQIHPAATCKDGLPLHIMQREGEREREIRREREGESDKKCWVSQWERRHQANGADGREEQTKASDCHHKHSNPEIWPHMSACKQSTSLLTHTHTLTQHRSEKTYMTHTHAHTQSTVNRTWVVLWLRQICGDKTAFEHRHTDAHTFSAQSIAHQKAPPRLSFEHWAHQPHSV